MNDMSHKSGTFLASGRVLSFTEGLNNAIEASRAGTLPKAIAAGNVYTDPMAIDDEPFVIIGSAPGVLTR